MVARIARSRDKMSEGFSTNETSEENNVSLSGISPAAEQQQRLSADIQEVSSDSPVTGSDTDI